MFALAWQVLAVSTGAYVILMILIKRDSVAATTSLMFLVPPVTAIIAFFIFGEPVTVVTGTGFLMASTGVYLVTRYARAAKGWLELTAVYHLFCRTAQAAGQILGEFVIFTFKPA